MKSLWTALWSDESGQTLTEYALIIALVSIGLILALTAFRDSIGRLFVSIRNTLDNAPGTPFTTTP